MAKTTKKVATKTETLTDYILEALNFVVIAQEKDQLSYQTHCAIYHNRITATDGFLTASHPLPVDPNLSCAPKTHDLLKALKALKAGYDLTLTDGTLTVSSDKTRVKVPVLSLDSVPQVSPDAPLCNIPATVVQALSTVAFLADEKAPRLALASVLLRNYSAAATNGFALLESWHGELLPTGDKGVAIPKAGLKALLSIKQAPIQLGISDNSITFYFANGAWLKIQRFSEEWPDIDAVLNYNPSPSEVPKEFIDAIDTAAKFADLNKIYLVNGVVKSTNQPNAGAYIDCPFLSLNSVFNAETLNQLAPMMEKAEAIKDKHKIYFFGNLVRGAIIGGPA